MESIYEIVQKNVFNGSRFNVDFSNRSVKLGKKYLIKNGEYDEHKYHINTFDNSNINDVLKTIEILYDKYKSSVPSERSENKRKKYFKSKTVDELTDSELVCNMGREVAQANLEVYILCNILTGNLYWDEELMGKWFWQGDDCDLILLKKWILK